MPAIKLSQKFGYRAAAVSGLTALSTTIFLASKLAHDFSYLSDHQEIGFVTFVSTMLTIIIPNFLEQQQAQAEKQQEGAKLPEEPLVVPLAIEAA